MEDNKGNEREELYSQRVRAGKRTYFFDVRTTRGGDYYVTITESKKVFNDDGFYYQKHKIFLYKEDFNKFQDSLNRQENELQLLTGKSTDLSCVEVLAFGQANGEMEQARPAHDGVVDIEKCRCARHVVLDVHGGGCRCLPGTTIGREDVGIFHICRVRHMCSRQDTGHEKRLGVRR